MKSEIICLPHPSLHRPSRRVATIDKTIKTLIKIMEGQATAWEKGRPHEITVGLAAIQLNQPLKVILVRDNFDAQKPANFRTLINPKIIQKSGAVKVDIEGCLSVPDYYVHVPRYEKIKITALDLEGQSIRFKASGFLARVLQHECDHLQGLTIVDQAVEAENTSGQKFKFCRLGKKGKFIPVADSEVERLNL